MHINNNPKHEFTAKLRDAIQRELHLTRMLNVARNRYIYLSGQRDSNVYLVESGQVKLVFFTPEGREYVLAICTTGSLFGELCLCGQAVRAQSAVAMQDARLKAISSQNLLKILKNASLLEDLIQYLASCMAEAQQHIELLLSANSEQRLANMLLHLGNLIGTSSPYGRTTIPRILLEDLASMVGTTRSRVGFFIKNFEEQSLIVANADRSLTFEAEKLREFVMMKRAVSQNATNAISAIGSSGELQANSEFQQCIGTGDD
jgi:CRP/FNR family transcriptional regulator, cyclic AMP receptor protein